MFSKDCFSLINQATIVKIDSKPTDCSTLYRNVNLCHQIWYESGKRYSKNIHKPGEEMEQNWREDGSKRFEKYHNRNQNRGFDRVWNKQGKEKLSSVWNGKESRDKVNRWHKNGQKKCEYFLENSLRVGVELWWYENGQKWVERTWEGGNK